MPVSMFLKTDNCKIKMDGNITLFICHDAKMLTLSF